MAAKKPLLPPGSKWNNSDKSSVRNKSESDLLQNNEASEVPPKLFTSFSTDQLTSLCDNDVRRTPPRSTSDDFLRHDKVLSRKPLPPIPSINKIDDTTGTVDSAKTTHSSTTSTKPVPPYKARTSPTTPSKGIKPPILPRTVHSTNSVKSSIPEKPKPPKPPLPRKPHTVFAVNRTGLPYPRRPDIGESRPLEPPGLLQKTDTSRQYNSNRVDQAKVVKVPVNEANKSKLALEKMLLAQSMEVGAATAIKDTSVGNDRPVSMILTSQVLYCSVITAIKCYHFPT